LFQLVADVSLVSDACWARCNYQWNCRVFQFDNQLSQCTLFSSKLVSSADNVRYTSGLCDKGTGAARRLRL
jgi:hypothetical protein